MSLVNFCLIAQDTSLAVSYNLTFCDQTPKNITDAIGVEDLIHTATTDHFFTNLWSEHALQGSTNIVDSVIDYIIEA